VTLEQAIALAASAHAGQLDKAGQPYILHPLRVMLAFKPTEVDEQIAAVLHDVVEDTHLTLDALRLYGLPDHLVDAIDALTKRKAAGETYRDYVRRLAGNRIARRVKVADITHNRERMTDALRATGLMERYDWALDHLLAS
jgi:guanosine-3',5'-bis(diphosphate) 3'-pyrophosphohydrolase